MSYRTQNSCDYSMYYVVFLGGTLHYSDTIMSTMTSQITSLTIVYSTVYSGADDYRLFHGDMFTDIYLD